MIKESDIVNVRIIGINHPRNWYAKYVGTDKTFKAVLGRLDKGMDEGKLVYRTFFEGMLDKVGEWWTYEDCLHAQYIDIDNAEVV